jgi:hypothetical protein
VSREEKLHILGTRLNFYVCFVVVMVYNVVGFLCCTSKVTW